MADSSPGDPVIQATRESFDQDVFGRSHQTPVVVDFWAPWCAPCRTLAPILERLVMSSGGGLVLVQANCDELPEAASRFDVQGIPAVFAVVAGEIVDMFTGALPESHLRVWLDRVQAIGTLTEAKRLEASSPTAAELKYRDLASLAPQDAAPRIGLARVLLAQGRFEESRQLIDELERRGFLEPEAETIKAALELQGKQRSDLPELRQAALEAPHDLTRQLRLAEALAGNGLYEEALELCLTLVLTDRRGVGESARQLMVDMFRVLPGDSELTREYRRKLSAALF